MKEVLHRNKVKVALIHDSNFSSMSYRIVKEVWDNRFVKWVCRNAIVSAGSIFLLWDSCFVSVSSNWKGDFSISFLADDLTTNYKWMITSVYDLNSS